MVVSDISVTFVWWQEDDSRDTVTVFSPIRCETRFPIRSEANSLPYTWVSEWSPHGSP